MGRWVSPRSTQPTDVGSVGHCDTHHLSRRGLARQMRRALGGFARSGHMPRSVRSRPDVASPRRALAPRGAATETMAVVARSALTAVLSKSRRNLHSLANCRGYRFEKAMRCQRMGNSSVADWHSRPAVVHEDTGSLEWAEKIAGQRDTRLSAAALTCDEEACSATRVLHPIRKLPLPAD